MRPSVTMNLLMRRAAFRITTLEIPRPGILLAALSCLTSCTNTGRTSIPREESHYERVIEHQLGSKAAFERVGHGLSTSYPDLAKVLRDKAPDKGTYLLEPTVTYRTGGPMGTVHHAPYTLLIVTGDAKVELTFDLQQDKASGEWAPEAAIPYVRHDFDVVVMNIDDALSAR